ncbi:MAG: DUF58 domain-containing protein [Verrucomicrobiota bacterium]|nr:DUF58 domain-containing protein [Verrucomicrobiota bacterium]MED5472068.1 DUF58 domain-containing protein [Verrucomicrobiota bacterium]HAA88470.1 DUF58 domain-containing protein [Verrucomicrobiales bacterium]
MNTDSIKLLDADTLARADKLGMAARFIVEGYMAGEHKSPYRGFAIEFSQHREYSPGDDVRHLDWKVLGKTDRYYIKQYEQETNFVAHILVDGSESMQYGSGENSKLDYAKVAAACLAFLIIKQRDAVSLSLFDDSVREELPRGNTQNHLFNILEKLVQFNPQGETDLAGQLHALANRSQRKGLVIVISDFFDDEEAVLESVQHLRFVGHEVIGMQILDHDEIVFPFNGLVEFEGLENIENLKTRPTEIRKSYMKEFSDFQKKLKDGFSRNSSHFIECDTSKPLNDVLGAYLTFRRETASK